MPSRAEQSRVRKDLLESLKDERQTADACELLIWSLNYSEKKIPDKTTVRKPAYLGCTHGEWKQDPARPPVICGSAKNKGAQWKQWFHFQSVSALSHMKPFLRRVVRFCLEMVRRD